VGIESSILEQCEQGASEREGRESGHNWMKT